jgi:carbonic anhydrase
LIRNIGQVLVDIFNWLSFKPLLPIWSFSPVFHSSFEPYKVEDALSDLDCVLVIKEELNNLKHNKVWSLVERPRQNIVVIKWVFRNKQNKHGVVTRNKT